MFFNFPYESIGFSEEEWEDVSRTDKLIIRDFYLNGCDKDQTMLFGFYETDRKVRTAIKKYNLPQRVHPQLSVAMFNFACLNPAGGTTWY